MSQKLINIGTVANDGTGYSLRTAFDYINQNFTEIYSSFVSNTQAIPNTTVERDATGGITVIKCIFRNEYANASQFETANLHAGMVAFSLNDSREYYSDGNSWIPILGDQSNFSVAGNVTFTANATASGNLRSTGNLIAGNVLINGNVIGTTGTDEDLYIDPNGAGRIILGASTPILFDLTATAGGRDQTDNPGPGQNAFSIRDTYNYGTGNVLSVGVMGHHSANLIVQGDGNLYTGSYSNYGGGVVIRNRDASAEVYVPGLGASPGDSLTVYYGSGNIKLQSANVNVTGNLSIAGATSIGSLSVTSLTASGNVSGNNASLSGILSVTGNANVGNIGATNGVFSAISGLTALTVTGNVSVGNVTSTHGAFTGNVYAGNINSVSGILSVTGNANVGNIGAAAGIFTGNVTAGNINNVTGILSVTGNANVGNIGAAAGVFTGNVTAGNINGVSGILTVTGNATMGNLSTAAGQFTTVNTTGNVILATNVGSGVTMGSNANPDPWAVLDLATTTGALILPRMTTTQRNALTPSSGMMIYNISDAKFQVYSGSTWGNLSVV
jgi:hypothetical protein